jgi:regulator of protease activity HflC (stomatin/prohibitin superfamily)
VHGGARAGLIVFIAFVDRVHRVSLQIITMPIESQGSSAATSQRRRLRLAYYRVKDAIRSAVAIENVSSAIDQIAQTAALRRGPSHDAINPIREILDVQTEDWGIEVTVVELKDIQRRTA